MLGLRRCEVAQLLYFHSRFVAGTLRKLRQRLLIHHTLFGGALTGRIQAGTVLRTDVVALAVDAERVDDVQKQQRQRPQAHALRVIGNAHCLHGTRCAGTHLPVCGIGRVGLRISHRCVGDAVDVLHGTFKPPETAAGHICHMCFGGRLRIIRGHGAHASSAYFAGS